MPLDHPDLRLLLAALAHLSNRCKNGHPERVNAPCVGVGFSAGGGFTFYLMVFAPDKTIAAVSYCAPYIFKRRITSPPSPAVLNVPSVRITGELEHFNAPLAPDVDPGTGPARIDEVFVPYRPQGAEYAWMERQDLGHAYDENRQDVLGMPLLDAAVRARYPKDGRGMIESAWSSRQKATDYVRILLAFIDIL